MLKNIDYFLDALKNDDTLPPLTLINKPDGNISIVIEGDTKRFDITKSLTKTEFNQMLIDLKIRYKIIKNTKIVYIRYKCRNCGHICIEDRIHLPISKDNLMCYSDVKFSDEDDCHIKITSYDNDKVISNANVEKYKTHCCNDNTYGLLDFIGITTKV